MAEDPFTACAEQLAARPGLVRRLLDEHIATSDGWCRAHDGHAERHPCSIRRLAELASAHLARPGRPANHRLGAGRPDDPTPQWPTAVR